MRNFTHLLAQIHLDSPINNRDQQHNARSLVADAASQAEDHQALVFLDDANSAGQERNNRQGHHTDQAID